MSKNARNAVAENTTHEPSDANEPTRWCVAAHPMPVAVVDNRGMILYMNLAPGQSFFFVDQLYFGERRFRTVTAYIADDIDERVLLEITSLATGATYSLTVPNDTRVQLLML